MVSPRKITDAHAQPPGIAPYTEARRWARSTRSGLQDLWDETDRKIRLELKARGWQEAQQEATAHELMPVLFPPGCSVKRWIKADYLRVSKALAKLALVLDSQLDELTRITFDLYDALKRGAIKESKGKTRGKDGMTVSPHKLGLSCGLSAKNLQTVAVRRLSVKSSEFQTVIGIVKTAVGSLDHLERLLVRNMIQRGWRFVPPAWALEALASATEDDDESVCLACKAEAEAKVNGPVYIDWGNGQHIPTAM